MSQTSHASSRSNGPTHEASNERRVARLASPVLRQSALIILVLSVCIFAVTNAGHAQRQLAPVTNQNLKNVIPGQYIVVFKPGTARETVRAALDTVKRFGGEVGLTYTA